MKNKTFAQYLDLYFNNYLAIERNVSHNTIRSYKFVFKSLINYLINEKQIKIEKINFEVITKDIIRDYLNYLEKNNSDINTRNQRLAVIKSFYQYVKIEEPILLNNIQNILSIRRKKYNSQVFEYLTKEELNIFLNSIETNNAKGIRNLTLISLLYDSAIRAEELVSLKRSNVDLSSNPSITVLGKGNKKRTIPIMNSTKELLINYIDYFNIELNEYLFTGNKNSKASTKMINHIIKKYTKISNIRKNLSAHSFRHSRAIHLVESGVNLIYIRDILGHASIITTENYLKISLEIKRKAIEKVYPVDENVGIAVWHSNEDILNKLLNLK